MSCSAVIRVCDCCGRSNADAKDPAIDVQKVVWNSYVPRSPASLRYTCLECRNGVVRLPK